jgi:RNA polymerase sigma factor (sigma-70 family)
MNVHISYKVHKNPDIEKEINHLIEKLGRRLRAFRPELVHLKGLIEQNSPREGAVVSLNLRLPSGQMAAHESAPTPLAALKAACTDLILQLGKHKDLLRNSHKWRRRGTVEPLASEAAPENQASEENHASEEKENGLSRSATAQSGDIRSYVNAHIGRLERFVERELYFRESSGEMNPGIVTKDEVVDEVVVRALGGLAEAPQSLNLEPWLYRLARQSMNDLVSRTDQGTPNVVLQRPATLPDGAADDEAGLQFHQPDESIAASDTIADRATETPEDIAYTDELISLIQSALGDAGAGDREIFILHALEGFSVVEIAEITERDPDQVQLSIAKVRKKLRRSGPIRDGFNERHVQRTGTA